MNPMTITIVFKGTATILLIVGAIFQIRYGYKLYIEGFGVHADESIFEFGKVKLMPKSVGSMVMGTAAIWVLASVAMSPNYEHGHDIEKVFSFNEPEMQFIVHSVANTKYLKDTRKDIKDYNNKLLELYLQALNKNQDNKTVSFKIDDVPHNVEYGDAQIVKGVHTDTPSINQELKIPIGTAVIRYVTEVKNHKIKFIPEEVEIIKKKDIKGDTVDVESATSNEKNSQGKEKLSP